MRNKADAIRLACQIVYEYKDWGWEHISDMLATYERPERPPCNGDELMDLCTAAQTHKNNNLTFDEAIRQIEVKEGIAS